MTEVHQNDFDEIKKRLLKPPALYLPDSRGCLSHFQTHIILQQVDDFIKLNQANLSLIHMPLSDYLLLQNYLITELAVNVALFKHLLAKIDFDCTVDNLA